MVPLGNQRGCVVTSAEHVAHLRDLVASVRFVPPQFLAALQSQSAAMARIEGTLVLERRRAAIACGQRPDEAAILRECQTLWARLP